MPTPCLLSLGHGYSARALARLILPQGWRIIATHRDPAAAPALAAAGVEPVAFPPPPSAIAAASHVLSSVPPGPDGDPVLAALGPALAERAGSIRWAGYLSSTGVYGDHAGGWVDEDTPPRPETARGRARLAAERAWLDLGRRSGLAVHVFRVAGIYGPGRSPFDRLRAGTARRILKPGHVFGRIHVDDLAAVLAASMARPFPGRIYNVCDDLPAPQDEVIAEAARLIGLPPPPAVPLEAAGLSAMAESFYAASRRVSNRRIREELGVSLRHPDYRSGLAAILAAETAGTAGAAS